MWQYMENTQKGIGDSMNSLGIALLDVLGVAALKLELIATHLYLILVRQQILLGLQQLVIGLLWLTVSVLTWRFLLSVKKKRSWAASDRSLVSAVCILVIGASFLTGVSTITNSLPRIINPEYYALQDAVRILEAANNARK